MFTVNTFSNCAVKNNLLRIFSLQRITLNILLPLHIITMYVVHTRICILCPEIRHIAKVKLVLNAFEDIDNIGVPNDEVILEDIDKLMVFNWGKNSVNIIHHKYIHIYCYLIDKSKWL